MIDALGLAIREGFGLVIASLIPLLLVAAAAAILVGLLGAALGIRDAALGQIVRALAIVLALGVLIRGIATSTVEFTARTWAQLGAQDDPSTAEPSP
ncbi:Bacterial export protein, family 3 [Enhygromyxa salina]|uniref:Bacterial export protein, family 3 n=1 Tax=Enhygromyxa salina TaxID=215803 RepID=A0A2S9XF62_9BACT|nr:flagellar biosynthetic protein FliQ [Enhygromyxa salina]PRP91504.1 Bacterial export protein, family 3 [Enhygromyxa salina]